MLIITVQKTYYFQLLAINLLHYFPKSKYFLFFNINITHLVARISGNKLQQQKKVSDSYIELSYSLSNFKGIITWWVHIWSLEYISCVWTTTEQMPTTKGFPNVAVPQPGESEYTSLPCKGNSMTEEVLENRCCFN